MEGKSYTSICIYTVVILTLIFAYFFDFEIATYLYQPNSWFGFVMERFMLLPLLVLFVFSWYVAYHYHRNPMYLIAFYISSSYVVYDTLQYWMNVKSHFLLYVVIASFVSVGFHYFCYQKRYRYTTNLRLWLQLYRNVFIWSLLSVVLLKQVWGRVRFYQLQGDVSLFTPWIEVHWFQPYHSFPSGHTAMMSTSMVIFSWYKEFSKHSQFHKKIKYIIALCILLMMVARMRLGAHYLSDVCVGFLITYTIYTIYHKKWKKEKQLYEVKSIHSI